MRVDTFGNRTHEIAYGVVGEDETITSVTNPELVPTPSEALGEGNWSWRTHESWVQGDNGVKRNWARTDYDSFGDPIESSVFLSAAMTREEMRRTAGLASLPMPPPDDTWITTAKTRYDALGNSIFTWAAGGRCARVTYDGLFGQLPIIEEVYVGGAGEQTVGSETFDCGARVLPATADYDYGLQAVTRVTDVNGGTTDIRYDGFGRLDRMWAPSAVFVNQPSAAPTLMVEYYLPDVTGRPVSMLVSKTNDGIDENDTQSYHHSYAYVDGLGRTVATLSEADFSDDGFRWVVEGLTDYDKKGAEPRKYLAWTYDGDPTQVDLSEPPASRYGQQRYDAFGRASPSVAGRATSERCSTTRSAADGEPRAHGRGERLAVSL